MCKSIGYHEVAESIYTSFIPFLAKYTGVGRKCLRSVNEEPDLEWDGDCVNEESFKVAVKVGSRFSRKLI